VNCQEKNMSRIKVSKTAPALLEKDRHSKEWPVVVYLWAFGLAILGYAAGRVGLSSLPHPSHWMSGVIGAVAGILIGWIWYRWRGDVF
jgi:hypothetical protein